MTRLNALFKPVYLSTEDLKNKPIVNGQYLVDSITGATYIDVSGVRVLKERIIVVSYAELLEYKLNDGLIPGRTYFIHDYKTVYTLDNGKSTLGRESDKVVTPVEPIFVRAIDLDIIDENSAMSALYPTDIIYYTLDNSRFSYTDKAYSKGIIYYRKDIINNIEVFEDWRSIKYPTMTYTAKSALEYNEVSSFASGRLIKGNGVVGQLGSLFTYGKSKQSRRQFSKRESDVFETNLTPILNKKFIITENLPKYNLYYNSDATKQTVESVLRNSLNINDFDQNTETYNYMFSKEGSELLNLDNKNVIINKSDNNKLANTVIFGNVDNCTITCDNSTIIGNLSYSKVTAINSFYNGDIIKSTVMLEDSLVSSNIEFSQLKLIRCLVNLSVISYCNPLQVFDSYLGRFIYSRIPVNEDLIESFISSSAKFISKSKISSARNCTIVNITNSYINSELSGYVHELSEAHINCPSFRFNNICTITKFDFTNPGMSSNGVELEFVHLSNNEVEVGDLSKAYNQIVVEHRFKRPRLLISIDNGIVTIYLQHINEVLQNDLVLMQERLSYDTTVSLD